VTDGMKLKFGQLFSFLLNLACLAITFTIFQIRLEGRIVALEKAEVEIKGVVNAIRAEQLLRTKSVYKVEDLVKQISALEVKIEDRFTGKEHDKFTIWQNRRDTQQDGYNAKQDERILALERAIR
jgi:hypothetical protein